MARHLVDKTGCLEVRQKRCEELAAILWILLKINGSCRRNLKELFLTQRLSRFPSAQARKAADSRVFEDGGMHAAI
jgi:hypothetical protein